MQLIRKSMLAAAVLCLVQKSASADLLGVAGNYNAFIFSALVEDGGGSDGAIASGGVTDLTDFQVAANLSSGINLVSGDNLSMTRGSVNGDVFAATGGSATDTTVTGTVYSPDVFVGIDSEYAPSSDIPVDFPSVEAQLNATSSNLLTLTDNGSISSDPSDPDDLTFVGDDPGQNVFSIDDTVLDAVTGTITINIPLGATAVINVINTQGDDGDTLQATHFVFDASSVLWNFNTISSLSFGSFSGSILAPDAFVTMTGGTFDGTVVADVLDGTGDTLLTPGSGSTVTFPAPLPSALWAGLVLLTGLGIRRRFACR